LATAGLAAGSSATRVIGTSGEAFRATMARLNLGSLVAGIGHVSVPLSITSGTPDLHVFVFATEPAGPRRISGWTVRHQHIFHHRPNDLAFTRSPTSRPGRFAVLAAPFDLMDAQGPGVTGLDPKVPLNDTRLFIAPEAQRARLIALMNDVERLAREKPWIVQTPEPAKALAGTIMEALLACLTLGQPSRDRAAPGRHRQIVARMERALQERPGEMLSLPDLCAEVGVAQRTLNLACQEFLGQGAMQYARGRRLDHVHQSLKTSDPATTQVTSVAMRYGFWELGRFAQAYRLRFGERPSETLRRNAVRTDSRQGAEAVRAAIA